jgi:hypothetical protein
MVITKPLKIISRLILVLSFQNIIFGQVQLLEALIVGNRNNAEVWSDSNLVVDNGDVVKMAAVVIARVDGMFSVTYLCAVDSLIINNETVPNRKITSYPSVAKDKTRIQWYRIEPVNLDTFYSNTLLSVTPYPIIPYQEILIPEWSDKWIVNLPDLKSQNQVFPGTAWFKVEISTYNQYLASPGRESRTKVLQTVDYGGLSDRVFRIQKRGRSGNIFTDNLISLRNIPYIRHPVSWCGTWADHQTNLRIGGNLASFLVLAADLSDVPLWNYIERIPIPELNYSQITDYYKKEVHLNGDFYVTKDGQKIALNDFLFSQGDILLNKNRIAVLYQDLAPTGTENYKDGNKYLGRNDMVLECNSHSLRLNSVQSTIGDTLVLIRWKQRWPKY